MRPPDLKARIQSHLGATLDVPVVSTRPDDGTSTFVRIIGTGGLGRSSRVIQHVQLTIDSYDTSTGKTWELASRVDEAMYRLVQSDLPVSHVQGSTPADFPDPDTASARYTATYQLTTLCL